MLILDYMHARRGSSLRHSNKCTDSCIQADGVPEPLGYVFEPCLPQVGSLIVTAPSVSRSPPPPKSGLCRMFQELIRKMYIPQKVGQLVFAFKANH